MSRAQKIFLMGSFASAFGDTLLVFAVPTGLGLATGDVRSAVLMWLIPAVAIFLSTLLSRTISRRSKSSRIDYANLLFATGVLESVVAVLAYLVTSQQLTLVLICLFVFVYALAKEGIPRLLYNVEVYRYFVPVKDYPGFAGSNAALGILATLIATLTASILITTGTWKLALLVDALTFVLLAAIVKVHGQDSELETFHSDDLKKAPQLITGPLRLILFVVPLIFGINALCWNYLPLLSEKFGATNITTSLALIAFLRVPGMIAGFQTKFLFNVLSLRTLVAVLPTSILVSSLCFIQWPGPITISILIVFQGLIAGVYWPADYSIRVSLSSASLVKFNAMTIRRFAAVQFVACLMAMFIYRPGGHGLDYLTPAMISILVICLISASTSRRII